MESSHAYNLSPATSLHAHGRATTLWHLRKKEGELMQLLHYISHRIFLLVHCRTTALSPFRYCLLPHPDCSCLLRTSAAYSHCQSIFLLHFLYLA